MPKESAEITRFGLGEWYERSFVCMSPAERRAWAAREIRKRDDRPVCSCLHDYMLLRADPPRNANDRCNKQGGICSLRQYVRSSSIVTAQVGNEGRLCTVCPERFKQSSMIYRWVGEELLGTDEPIVLGEIGFLRSIVPSDSTDPDETSFSTRDVGKIDNILVHADLSTLRWCALEIQAVYASNSSYTDEFRALAEDRTEGLPWPATKPTLDYRSSSLKRLMPQLQVKVPSLRRWGKKMAVVVDESFFDRFGDMDRATDISNCDIVWFVTRYDESEGETRIARAYVQMSTLERTVEGLTAGYPKPLRDFEESIYNKLQQSGLTA